MYDLLQNTIIQCWHYLKNIDNIGNSNDFRDIYYLIDYLVYSVTQTYPQIPCKPQCSECCTVSGLPQVTALEWIIIHKYIVSELDLIKHTEIIMQNQYLHKERLPILIQQQKQLQQIYKQQRNQYTKNTKLNGFKNCTCPFLIDDLCVIYPVRPAICRAYGYFTVRKEEESTIFSCYSGAEQVITFLKEQGIEQLALPVWNKFLDKIYELNEPYKTVATLPLWILSHIKNKEIIDKVNINPDFVRFSS